MQAEQPDVAPLLLLALALLLLEPLLVLEPLPVVLALLLLAVLELLPVVAPLLLVLPMVPLLLAVPLLAVLPLEEDAVSVAVPDDVAPVLTAEVEVEAACVLAVLACPEDEPEPEVTPDALELDAVVDAALLVVCAPLPEVAVDVVAALLKLEPPGLPPPHAAARSMAPKAAQTRMVN